MPVQRGFIRLNCSRRQPGAGRPAWRGWARSPSGQPRPDPRRLRGCGGEAGGRPRRCVRSPVRPVDRIGSPHLGGGIIRAEGAVLAMTPVNADGDLFEGPGLVRGLLRSVDWAATALGPVGGWSPVLRTMVRAA